MFSCHPHSIPRRVSYLLAILPLALALALTACAPSGQASQAPAPTPPPTATLTPSPTPTPLPKASVVRVTKAQHFADSKSGGTSAPCANGDPLINDDCGVTVTATCASGAVIVSGGFMVDDALAFVTSSYPSSATTWTVTAHDEGQDGGSHPVTVTAYADCLHANFAAGVSTSSSTPSVPADSNPHDITQSCPAGSVVTGGGFRGTNSTAKSIPAANGWTAALSVQLGKTAHPKIFALCAKSHLAAAGHPKTTAAPTLGSGASLTVACPAGALLAGGGAQTVGFGNITTLAGNSALTQWQLKVSANGVVGGPVSTYSVADYAVCLKVK